MNNRRADSRLVSLGRPVNETALAERLGIFFERAPELKPLIADCMRSVEAEANMLPRQGGTQAIDLPRTLDDFRAIPPDALTLDVLECGAELSRRLCYNYGVFSGGQYGEMVSQLYAKDRGSVVSVHGAFISDLMAAEYVLFQPDRDAYDKATAYKLLSLPHFQKGPLFYHAWVLVGAGIHAHDWLYKAHLNESVLLDIYRTRPIQAKALCPPWMNQANVLERLITEGLCPSKIDLEPFQPVAIQAETPLGDCLAGYQLLKDYDLVERTCLAGLIKRNPIDAVIKAATTSEKQRTLREIYPLDVLINRAGKNNFLKGLLLEDAMGL